MEPEPPQDASPMDMGPQPLDALLEELNLSNHEVVAASTEQITHKMVAKGRRGRRLTRNIQMKLLRAVKAASGQSLELGQLFNYAGKG